LDAIAQIKEAEMAGANGPAGGGDEELAAALEHRQARVVEVGTGHDSGTTDDDVVAGAGAHTATVVGAQEVIPAVRDRSKTWLRS